MVGLEDADILYPKYKTAIFVKNCFDGGHECCYIDEDDNCSEYWNAWINERRYAFDARKNGIECTGWKTITIWTCELQEYKINDIILRIEKELKDLN